MLWELWLRGVTLDSSVLDFSLLQTGMFADRVKKIHEGVIEQCRPGSLTRFGFRSYQAATLMIAIVAAANRSSSIGSPV